MESKEKAKILLTAYEDLNWDMYIELCDNYLKVNSTDITKELETQAIQYSYYSGLLAMAQEKVDEIELNIETFMGQAGNDARSYLMLNDLKVTDKAVEGIILSKQEYKNLVEKRAEVKTKFNLLKSLVAAMSMRKDSLIQISSNSRAETRIYG